ncbi:group I truncated hemoglobin [Sunxiuqinia elliptica]|uniref:Hemoglobin n=1 Tax=Sunxiuqinia elliptica TaxID=655355 RepID=A0A1I2HS15_9BACT|nr:group 1 truncated hemoglobin [Sunxiuqinia elliptica]SFF31647.1 hemoglobin [Sunxiuqinia elliptica]
MEKSLFERLGGTDGITQIVDDAIDAHMNNPQVSARFLPYREMPEQLALVKKHSVEFFSEGSGGPTKYSGKDMSIAHRGMNISPAEYMHVLDDILETLDKHKIDEGTKKDVLSILWSLKDMIIAQ